MREAVQYLVLVPVLVLCFLPFVLIGTQLVVAMRRAEAKESAVKKKLRLVRGGKR